MHEPPTKRSWYISVATSTLRAVILAAAIVIGIVVIRNAFPQNASQDITTTTSPSNSVTTSPSVTPTASPSASVSASPRVKGVTVQVLNGTDTTGLAGIVTGRLKKAGYTMRAPGGVNNASKTTIYYQEGFQPEAQFLKEKHFPKAVLAPAPSGFKANLTVVLGSNFVLSS
jgi:LytR cell envelope-related transcriptional attenuator